MFQPEFDLIVQHDAAKAAARSAERIASHIASMRCCWPGWEGPRVEESVHGRCTVHSLTVDNLTTGDNRYHYMAECKIESVSEDGLTVIAAIDYEPGSTCSWMNGQRLRLHITDVWPWTDHDAYDEED